MHPIQNLENVVQLKLLPENDNEKARIFSLSQLNDLQSKLMLVAGKAALGKEEVDRFVEVSKCVGMKP